MACCVNYDYYLSEYCDGRCPVIENEDDYPFFLKWAFREVDALTFGRLKNLTEYTEEIKDCLCAIADVLYKGEKAKDALAEDGAPGGALASYSNDGESRSFTYQTAQEAESIYTESGRRREIKRICVMYLGNTGMLYAGRTGGRYA